MFVFFLWLSALIWMHAFALGFKRCMSFFEEQVTNQLTRTKMNAMNFPKSLSCLQAHILWWELHLVAGKGWSVAVRALGGGIALSSVVEARSLVDPHQGRSPGWSSMGAPLDHGAVTMAPPQGP